MKRRLLLAVALGAVALVFLASPAPALMKALTIGELTVEADLVVRGEVLAVQSAWSADGKSIYTKATLLVSEAIKGRTDVAEIAVQYPGGEVGGVGMMVSDTPAFHQGEEVIVFLRSGGEGGGFGAYEVAGLAQGKYTICDDGLARKGGFIVLDETEKTDTVISVDELINKIKEATGGQK